MIISLTESSNLLQINRIGLVIVGFKDGLLRNLPKDTPSKSTMEIKWNLASAKK